MLKEALERRARGVAPDAKGGNNEAGSGVFWNGTGRPLNAIEVMATGQANAETATDHCVNLTCNHEAPIICAGFSGGQGENAGGIGYQEEVAPTIRSSESGSNQVPDILCQYGDVAGALTARHDSSPCVDRGQNIVFDGCLMPGESQSIRIYRKDGAFPTIKANENGGQNRQSVLCYENHAQDSRIKPCGECSPQINAKAGTGGGNLPILQEIHRERETTIAFRWAASPSQGLPIGIDYCHTMMANKNGEPAVCYTNARNTVRRLTPRECERLMGFPDNWTRIPWRGKPAEDCPDSPRYKACGNSMCVNVMRWIGMRIEYVERKKARGEEWK